MGKQLMAFQNLAIAYAIHQSSHETAVKNIVMFLLVTQDQRCLIPNDHHSTVGQMPICNKVNDKLWPFKLQTYSHFAPTKLNTAYRFIFGEVIYSMQLVPQVFFTLPRGTLHYQPPQFQEDPTRSKRKNNSGLLHTTSSLLQPLRKMLQRTRLTIMKRLPSAIESNHRLSQPPLKKCARDRT